MSGFDPLIDPLIHDDQVAFDFIPRYAAQLNVKRWDAKGQNGQPSAIKVYDVDAFQQPGVRTVSLEGERHKDTAIPPVQPIKMTLYKYGLVRYTEWTSLGKSEFENLLLRLNLMERAFLLSTEHPFSPRERGSDRSQADKPGTWQAETRWVLRDEWVPRETLDVNKILYGDLKDAIVGDKDAIRIETK